MKRNSQSSRAALTRILIAVVLLAASIVYVTVFRKDPQMYATQTVPPTCTENGYTLYTNKENGYTFVDDMVPAAGHQYGDWTEEEGGILVSSRVRSCVVCGASEAQSVYPELPIPVLTLEGSLEGIGKENDVNVEASFSGAERSFNSFATLKYQGHSSLNYDKKNYTLKFFADSNANKKNKMTFSHWNPEHKYILKANYIDSSQSRNLLCADLWAEMVAARDRVPAQLKHLSNYGAVDGFPVALYINGSFQGLYTMNLHKDDDLFGMEDGYENAIVILNTDTAEESTFRAVAAFREDTPWEVEYCGTQSDQWAKDKLNELITFVMQSDDETFRNELGRYLDVDSAVDYLIGIYAMGLTYHGDDELVLVCYDDADPWIASMYDMETGFGLCADGTACLEPEEFLPRQVGDTWDSGTGSLLWDRLLENFQPEIRQRYQQLRRSVLDPERMCERVTGYLDAIGPELYSADNEVFPQPNLSIDHRDQIVQYITRRAQLLDNILLPNQGG